MGPRSSDLGSSASDQRQTLAELDPTYVAALLIASYIAFESPLSGMSTNPARTFGPAFYGSYWHALWVYFSAPPLGMLAAAEAFLLARRGEGPFCAKLITRTGSAASFVTLRQPRVL